MPRARGPGRDIRRSGIARREGRSSTSRHPYHRQSTATAAGSNLRRSSRIAEQQQQQQQQQQQLASPSARGHSPAPHHQNRQQQQASLHSPIGESITDIAQHTQTTPAPISGAIESDLPREPSRQRSTRRIGPEVEADIPPGHNDDYTMGQRTGRDSSRHSVSSEDELPHYAMDVITQPPTTSQPGRSLNPVVTVRLRSTQASDVGDGEVAHLLAVATLVAEHADKTPEQLQNALSGRRFDSIHPFGADYEDNRGVGYVSFPDLVIGDEGVYRIRVTLIKVRNNGDNGSPIPDGGSNVHAVETNPIAVGGSAGSEVESMKE